MSEKLKNFTYSQNSINTYKSCPIKFRYKYIDRINWRNDEFSSREYYESLVMGSEFHLVCERYFSSIPLGINKDTNPKFLKWIEKIKKLLPQSENLDRVYLPEYEVRYNLNKNIISAKYDLVVLKDNTLEIWDWKTESKRVDYNNAQNRIQTVVYMYLAKEVIPKIYNIDIPHENITMKYYQPEFEDDPISIGYNEDIHKKYESMIKKYIDFINDGKYELRNEKHCKYCEFNKLCNNEEVRYECLEEEIDEC